MLQTVSQNQHPNYPYEFKEAVRQLFPVLCYTPEQIEAFLKEYQPQFDGKNCVVEDGQGRRTYCRLKCAKREIFVEYIIPSVWEERYPMVKDAILQFKHHFVVGNSGRYLRMHVDERIPSHAAYYLGLLPELGFTLTPRVTMTAPPDLVRQWTLPELLPSFQETGYEADQLGTVIDVYARAFSGKKQQELSAEEWSQRREEEAPYLTRVYALESTVRTWTGLTWQGRLIGCAWGDARDDVLGRSGMHLCLEEVALVPEFQGKGLGRYLTIRCLQKMYENWGGSERYFFLGTDRRWKPALKLYHRLGFSIDRVESYAFLTNNIPGP
jgi:GNAT superfamily N-acetyltransferase